MSRSQLRLDIEDMRYDSASVYQNNPMLAVLTTPDFLKEVNFHERIATFGKNTQSDDWSEHAVKKNDILGSPDISLPYISNGYLADPYVSSSVEYELPTELEDIGTLVKKEPSSEPTSDKELTDREYEEKLKLERRRMKNREAAHRCRRKKMEKIAQLEGQVRSLQTENSRIMDNIKRLEKEAAYLRALCRQRRCPRCDPIMDQ